MPTVTIDKEKIFAAIKAEFEAEYWLAKFDELGELYKKGISPFRLKADNTPEGWAGLVEAQAIASEIIHHAIVTAERVCADIGAVGAGKEKMEAVAKFLDDIIALPFYLEPFDGPLIKAGLGLIVKGFEKLFGKEWLSHIPTPNTI